MLIYPVRGIYRPTRRYRCAGWYQPWNLTWLARMGIDRPGFHMPEMMIVFIFVRNGWLRTRLGPFSNIGFAYSGLSGTEFLFPQICIEKNGVWLYRVWTVQFGCPRNLSHWQEWSPLQIFRLSIVLDPKNHQPFWGSRMVSQSSHPYPPNHIKSQLRTGQSLVKDMAYSPATIPIIHVIYTSHCRNNVQWPGTLKGTLKGTSRGRVAQAAFHTSSLSVGRASRWTRHAPPPLSPWIPVRKRWSSTGCGLAAAGCWKIKDVMDVIRLLL